MSNPFPDDGIVMEGETNSETRYMAFEPNGFPDGAWVHDVADFDELDRETVVDQYALPDESVDVLLVDVPAGESVRMGSVGPRDGHSGGADLVQLSDRPSIPESWVTERTSLASLLE